MDVMINCVDHERSELALLYNCIIQGGKVSPMVFVALRWFSLWFQSQEISRENQFASHLRKQMKLMQVW